MLLTIIAITVIGLALGATLAVWVVHDAISKQPMPVAGTNGAMNASTIAHTVGWDLRQDAGVALPWRREVQPGADGRLDLWVQNAGATGSVTCRIIVDGTTIREETTAMPYGVCRVSASTS